MIYLLVTNTCIRYINGRVLAIRRRLAQIRLENVGVSTISKGEMFYGSAKSQTPELSLKRQEEFLTKLQNVPFDIPAAKAYGVLRAYLEKLGTPIGSNDMLIAATALAHDLILVTHNTREFSRVPNLKLEDWEIDS
jgi:tRNA(fMet)-specific endonuclease VapC